MSLLAVDDVARAAGSVMPGGAAGDGDLLVARGIIDADHEHEAVELRLGQRIGALLLDRVLRRQDEERRIERVGAARRW